MTLCIATLCEGAQTLIMASDNFLTMGFVSAELPIEKLRRIHPDWWVLLAGSTPKALEIIDSSKSKLDDNKAFDLEAVTEVLTSEYQKVRLHEAESQYLKSRGWTLPDFKDNGIWGRMAIVDTKPFKLSLSHKAESSSMLSFWIPAFAGMTAYVAVFHTLSGWS